MDETGKKINSQNRNQESSESFLGILEYFCGAMRRHKEAGEQVSSMMFWLTQNFQVQLILL